MARDAARRGGWRLLLLAVGLGVLLTPADPARAQWFEVDRLLGSSGAFTFGVDTSRFRVSTLGAKPVIATDDQASEVPYRLIDPDLHGTAVSFDLKLRWPSSASSGAPGIAAVEPYFSFGPTLFALGFDAIPRPGQQGLRSEGSVAMGLHWGAGLSWHLWKNTRLFGGYRFLQSGSDNVLLGGDRASESDLTGHDVLYGISIRF